MSELALIDPVPALIAAVIWALTAIYYRDLQSKLGFIPLNLFRTSVASAVLLVPGIYLGVFQALGGIGFAALSGLLSLAVGDSLFLIAMRKVGASVASPVVYTNVLFVQLTASVAAEKAPLTNLLSSGLVLIAVVILSKGERGIVRLSGIGFALGASGAYTAGNLLIRISTNAGGNFLTVAFVRIATAALALGVVTLMSRSAVRSVFSKLTARDALIFAGVAICDLALGSTLLVYSVSTVGVTETVILASVAPILAQVSSRILGKEAPRTKDFLGGIVIMFAIVVALAV